MSVRTPASSGAKMAPAYPSFSAVTASKTARRMVVMKLVAVSIGLCATNQLVVLFIYIFLT